VNDPGLITLVNKLQDVFTTVGVRNSSSATYYCILGTVIPRSRILMPDVGPKPYRSAANRRRRVAVQWKEFGAREHCWARLVSACCLRCVTCDVN
jgi:hypothetical protein